MKIHFKNIDTVFETEQDCINVLVIESPKLFYETVSDVYEQISGYSGKAILSENNIILDISKRLELLDNFIPFDINKKSLVNKMVAAISRKATQAEFYQRSVELIADIERLLWDLSFDLPGDISFSSLGIDNIVKSVGVELRTDKEELCEKILDYIEAVTEFDKSKLFITVNLRSYINDESMGLFAENILQHGYHLVMLENKEYHRFEKELRYIVDESLCEIC